MKKNILIILCSLLSVYSSYSQTVGGDHYTILSLKKNVNIAKLLKYHQRDLGAVMNEDFFPDPEKTQAIRINVTPDLLDIDTKLTYVCNSETSETQNFTENSSLFYTQFYPVENSKIKDKKHVQGFNEGFNSGERHHPGYYKCDIEAEGKSLTTTPDFWKNNFITLGNALYQSKNIKFKPLTEYQSTPVVVHLTLVNLRILEIDEIIVPGLNIPISEFNKSTVTVKEYTPDNVFVSSKSFSLDHVYESDLSYLLNPKMGNKLKFIVPKQSSTKLDRETGRESVNPIIKGVPSTWIAKFGEEVLYYCTPNTTPSDYKPWIGFDTWVHTLWVRDYKEEYGNNWNPIEDDWKQASEIYGDKVEWSWRVQRRMDPNKKIYTPEWTWSKTKDLSILESPPLKYPVTGTETYYQRNSQKEGTLMDILHSWPNWYVDSVNSSTYLKYQGKKYAHGFDNDEIVYFGSKDKNTLASPPSVGLFKFSGNDPWKFVPENGKEGIPINDVVTAYQFNREAYIKKNFKYAKKYDGYEIQDLATDTLYPNGKGIGVSSAPGWITITTQEKSVEIPIKVVSPLAYNNPSYVDPGFYGVIEGTKWPAINEKNVPYTVRNIPLKERDKLVMVYSFSDGFNQDEQVFYSSDYDISNGDWTVEPTIKGWGYNYLTLYYEPIRGGERTMIGGKELFYIEIMYVSNWGKPFNEARADRQHLVVNEFRTSEYGAPYTNDGPWNNKVKKQFYRYTFKKDDPNLKNFTLSTFDVDPHTFKTKGVDWYQPERKIANGIPDIDPEGGESLDTNIKIYIAKCASSDCSNEPKGDLEGSGQDWKKDWSIEGVGTYQVTIEYRNTQQLHILIDIVNYSDNDNRRGSITTRNLTEKERKWLNIDEEDDPDGNKYKVAEVNRLLSNYKLINGPRVNKKPNRFGEDKDFGYLYQWDTEVYDYLSFGYVNKVLNQIPKVASFISAYSNKSWFPENWVRHYYVNTYKGNINDGLPLDVNKSLIYSDINSPVISAHLDNILGIENSGKPFKQINLPWVIISEMDGKRIRMPPKPIFNLEGIWDNDTGAFSGNPRCNKMGCDNYYLLAHDNDPKDEDKDKEEFYNLLRTNSIIVYNDLNQSVNNFLSVSNVFDPSETEDEQHIRTRPIISPEVNNFTIDFSDEHQEIDAFGASDAWSINTISNTWNKSVVDILAQKLFSVKTHDGNHNPQSIGLTGWRFNVGAGSTEQEGNSGISDPLRRTESFLNADGTYSFNKQFGSQYFLNLANEKYEVPNLTMFSNSPPVHLTSNGKAHGNWNLQYEKHQDFADFLTTVSSHFSFNGTFIDNVIKNENVKFDFISPVNETQYSWENKSQEGNAMDNNMMKSITHKIARNLHKINDTITNDSNKVISQVVLSEASDYAVLLDQFDEGWNSWKKGNGSSNFHSYNQIDEVFAGGIFTPLQVEGHDDVPLEDEAKDYIAKQINVHGYWSHILPAKSEGHPQSIHDAIELRRDVQRRMESLNSNLPEADQWKLSQSEFAFYGTLGAPRNVGMNTALQVARAIHIDLTEANVNSWFWWLALSTYDYNDGLIYTTTNENEKETYTLSKTFWALGHYSRFIRPGSKRVQIDNDQGVSALQAASKDLNGLMLSAYKQVNDDETISNYVIVAVNMSSTDYKISLKDVNDQNANIQNLLHQYVTKEGDFNMKYTGLANVLSKSSKHVLIPKQSIVTLSQRRTDEFPLNTYDSGGNSEAQRGTSNDLFNENEDKILRLDDDIVPFPNPVSDGFLSLYFKQKLNNNIDLKIYDIQGRLVKVFNNMNTDDLSIMRLDITSLSTGSYFIKVNVDNKEHNLRFIIQQ